MKPPPAGWGVKAAATKIGAAKFVAAGGTMAAFGARRALWPFMLVGGAFSGAAWLGSFEFCWMTCKLLMPIPNPVDKSARNTGLATLPVTIGSTWWLGWKLCPEPPPPPTSITDISGAIRTVKSLPVKHFALVGATSALASAVTCRVVQYRGGA